MKTADGANPDRTGADFSRELSERYPPTKPDSSNEPPPTDQTKPPIEDRLRR